MKQLLVFGDKTFRITIPDDAKVTFGPWSPPNEKGGGYVSRGTLRVYQGSKDNILCCFSGVTGFRDLSMQYAEQIAREEGATIWKDDENGYTREHKQSMTKQWVEETDLLPAPTKRRKR